MEYIPENPLVRVTYDEMKKTRKLYEVDDDRRITESLDAIQSWILKQPHLAETSQYLPRSVLERLFILARGSTEATKQKIDKMFTLRALMPELSLNRTLGEFEKLGEHLQYIAVPKLSPQENSRIMITKFISDKLDDFSILAYFRYTFLIGDFRLHYDYCFQERYIIDLKTIKHMSLIAKLNPILVKKSEILCTEAYGTSIKGIHLINVPPFVDKVVTLLKQALKEKVASRIYVHNSNEDLQKYIPKEILPKDYGGDEVSCDKLAEQWRAALSSEDGSRIIWNTNKLVADESKRQSLNFNLEYMGVPGSFRKLNVD